ncbi:MAG: serine hydrolase [Armatimonadota bacterium]
MTTACGSHWALLVGLLVMCPALGRAAPVRSPYPPSPVLRLAELSAEVTRREDIDGDNWPLTWADDGKLYAAYGDGWGCRPLDSAPKLNTGMVVIDGSPPDFSASELKIPWFGGGAENPNFKGCGLLSVDGVLYHFLRYQARTPASGNERQQIASQLIWSRDHGRTWQNASYAKDVDEIEFFFREPDCAFHTPTFLQGGRDYALAQDDYVYIYSPNEDRRRNNDNLVVARVPQDKVTDRGAYQFFSGLDNDGNPTWTADIAQRRPVFSWPGHVGNGDVVYNHAVDRYLLVTFRSPPDAASTLGLFDAPHPWGPWTEVGVVGEWGSGRGGDRRYDPRIPVKWISEDGLSFYLVYSDRIGSDKLNYQQVRLAPAGEAQAPAAARGRIPKLPSRPGPFEWRTASPESQGMSSAKLGQLRDGLAARGTKTLLVVRGDRIVYEWYAEGFGPTRQHYTASLAKALVGGVSLMLALNDGRIAVDDPAHRYIPAWRDHPQKSKITIRHLATHSSGIEDAEQDDLPHNQLPGWKGQFWKRDPDPFTIARDQAPVVFEPGTQYAYSNPGMAMLAYAVTASLKGAPQSDIRSLLAERIMRSIGVPDGEWSIGYGRTYEVDGLKLVANWGGGGYTARAVARVGRLMLRKGNWDGRQLVDPKWVEQVTAYAGTPLPERPPGNPQPGSGLGWWTNFDGVWPSVPKDAFAGAGAGNQILLVVPSLDLIVVRNGSQLGNEAQGEGFWGGLERYLFEPLMQAIDQ